MKIKYINHSVANRYDGYIEVNKHLRQYPKLLGPILKHELSHTDKPWSLKDLKLDLVPDDKVDQWKLIKFMLKHPMSFTQVLPILYSKEKGFIFDINLIIIYTVLAGAMWIMIQWGLKFL